MKVNWMRKFVPSANCVKSLPQVFKVEDGKFVIDPSAAPEDEVRAVRCQMSVRGTDRSGRLNRERALT